MYFIYTIFGTICYMFSICIATPHWFIKPNFCKQITEQQLHIYYWKFSGCRPGYRIVRYIQLPSINFFLSPESYPKSTISQVLPNQNSFVFNFFELWSMSQHDIYSIYNFTVLSSFSHPPETWALSGVVVCMPVDFE
jgi:hypothetical protein